MATKDVATTAKGKGKDKGRAQIVEECLLGQYMDAVSKRTKDGKLVQQRIGGFSPNNVRSVVFGAKGFLVLYHIVHSGTHNKAKAAYFNYAAGVDYDLQLLAQSKADEIKSLFVVFSEKRKFSCIEEILFTQDADALTRVDVAKGIGTVTLEKFDRLRNVGVWQQPMSLPALCDAVCSNTVTVNNLNGLVDALSKVGTFKSLMPVNNSGWYNHANLVPQSYSLDDSDAKGSLAKHFAEVREQCARRERVRAARKKEREDFQRYYTKTENEYRGLLDYLSEVISRGNRLYEVKGCVDRTKWTLLLGREQMFESMAALLRSDRYKELFAKCKDEQGFTKLKTLAVEYKGEDNYITQLLEKVYNPVMACIPQEPIKVRGTGEGEGKLSVVKQQALFAEYINFAFYALTVLVYAAYNCYILYSDSNTMINHILNTLDMQPKVFKYHKGMVELAKIMSIERLRERMGYFGDVFELCSASELDAKTYKATVRSILDVMERKRAVICANGERIYEDG